MGFKAIEADLSIRLFAISVLAHTLDLLLIMIHDLAITSSQHL